MSSSVQPLENKELKILLDNKEDLDKCFPFNLLHFSEELCKSKVISKEVKDVSAGLDHGHGVRYLLQHIYEGVKKDVVVFHQFLKVLAELGGGAEQVSRHLGEQLGVPVREAYYTEGQANDPAGSSEAVHDINLSEDNVPVLMKTLAGVTYKWEELSISLGLPVAVCKECGSGSSNAVRLRNILYEWVTGKYQTAVPATLSNLKKELASELVGVASVALDLEKAFQEAMIPSVTGEKTASVPPKNKHLVNMYSLYKEVPQDTSSWPPVGASNFINLALITKNEQRTHHYDYSVRGDVDDIIESKEEVKYEDVFGKYEHGGLVIVEGRPGSGKTTLVHKVARDWATGEDVLRNANMVFLILLRTLANRKDENPSDFLNLFYQSKHEREKVLETIEKTDGEEVCFVIDGLDEYHPQDERNSVIYRLLYKTYLPAAMVIVASRPIATDKLRRTAPVRLTRRIEVLGFTRQQTFDYITEYPFNSDISKSATLASKLKKYLNFRPNILHMCYLPVHAAMICFLYEHERGNIPPTETKIYELFTRFIVLRKLKRSDESARLYSVEDLHGKDEEYFSKVCHLAFDMTVHCKQSVHQSDVEVPLSLGTGPNDVPSLGLVTIDSTTGLCGLEEDTYAFLHLTLQEYLAALYLAKLKDKKQMEMIRVYAGKKHMRAVWKFYFGIVTFKKKKVAKIQEIMQYRRWRGASLYASLYEVKCAFESQQRVVCDYVVERTTGVLDVSGCTLTLADMTSLCYVISTTSHPVTKLAMRVCHLHADHVIVFLREVSNNKLKCLKTLYLYSNSIGADGSVALAGGLTSCTNLQTLGLSYNNIGADGAVALAIGLKSCTNLQTLDLSGNNLGADGAAGLARGLKSYTNLQTLDLNNNNIGDDGAVGLAGGLKFCTSLQTLVLSRNNIGDDGAVGLANGLKYCTNLQTLDLSGNNIGDDGAVGLAKGLKSCTNQQTLDLSGNNIGDYGQAALAHLKCHMWH